MENVLGYICGWNAADFYYVCGFIDDVKWRYLSLITYKASCRPDADSQWSQEIIIRNVLPALIAYAHSAGLIIGCNI